MPRSHRRGGKLPAGDGRQEAKGGAELNREFSWHRTGLDPDCTALAIQLEGCGITLPDVGEKVSEEMLFGLGGGIGHAQDFEAIGFGLIG